MQSSSLSRGRRRSARRCSTVCGPKFTPGRKRTVKVFTPNSLPAKSSFMYLSIPLTIAITPIRKVTPMKAPTHEKKLLSFWARVWASAILIASSRLTSSSGGALLVRAHQAVVQRDDARRVRGDVVLVRDHHDGLAVRLMQVGEDLHDLLARGRVEVAGGLVGQDD